MKAPLGDLSGYFAGHLRQLAQRSVYGLTVHDNIRLDDGDRWSEIRCQGRVLHVRSEGVSRLQSFLGSC